MEEILSPPEIKALRPTSDIEFASEREICPEPPTDPAMPIDPAIHSKVTLLTENSQRRKRPLGLQDQVVRCLNLQYRQIRALTPNLPLRGSSTSPFQSGC